MYLHLRCWIRTHCVSVPVFVFWIRIGMNGRSQWVISEWGVSPERDIWSLCGVLAGGCGAWRLLASRSRRHSMTVPILGPQKRQKSTKSTRYMLQKSRACFFWGRRTAGGRPPPVAQLGGTLKPVKMTIISRNCRHFPKTLTFPNFKIWKSKSCNVSGSSFHISKNPDLEKIQIFKKYPLTLIS